MNKLQKNNVERHGEIEKKNWSSEKCIINYSNDFNQHQWNKNSAVMKNAYKNESE